MTMTGRKGPHSESHSNSNHKWANSELADNRKWETEMEEQHMRPYNKENNSNANTRQKW